MSIATEFEAKFLYISRDEITQKLLAVGAKLERPEYMQKRVNFELPQEKRSHNTWLRVRDEGDKTTLSLKMITGESITDQKEIELVINNFDKAASLLENIGCQKKALQESKRELWILDDVQITIDTWPALETFIEIEGSSEEEVKNVSERLNFDFSKAVFSAVGKLYKMRFGMSLDEIEKKYGEITFDNSKLKELKNIMN